MLKVFRQICCVLRVLLVAVLAPLAASDKPATKACNTKIDGPTSIAYDGAGFLFIVERQGEHLIQLDLKQGLLHQIRLSRTSKEPHAVVSDGHAGIYVSDSEGGLHHFDRSTGLWETLVRGADSSDKFDAMVVDRHGNLYLAQGFRGRVLMWNPLSKQFSIVAGTGKGRFSGDEQPALEAALSWPQSLALTPQEDLLVADYGNCRIRRIEKRSGMITTIAGTGPYSSSGECGFNGDGGPATQARLSPEQLAVDRSGAIFVSGDNRIRRIDPSTGLITTFGGTGSVLPSGDGGPVSQATLANVAGMTVDNSNNIYISEYVGNRVRRIDSSGIIRTIAGNGLPHRDVMSY